MAALRSSSSSMTFAFLQPLQGHFHHAHRSFDNALARRDDRTGLLLAQLA